MYLLNSVQHVANNQFLDKFNNGGGVLPNVFLLAL